MVLRRLTLLLVVCAAPLAHAGVLVVGDSLEVGTGPHLKQELAGQSVTVDARTGRPSPEGLGVLRSRISGGDDVVVFDLGTNDDPGNPGLLTRDLASARSVAGRRCLVVATVSRPPLNGKSVDGLNSAVDSFASGDGNVQVVRWHEATERNPGLLAGDGVHPGPAGYAERAKLVADAVRLCGASGGKAKVFPTHGPRLSAHDAAGPRARSVRLDLAALGHWGPARAAAFVMREMAAAIAFGAEHVGGGLLGLRVRLGG